MRRSGVRFPEAAPRSFGLASRLFWRILEGQLGLILPVPAPFGPHLVRIRSREGPVELVRNGVEVIGEEAGIDVEGHGGGGVPEHLLHRLDVGASGYGEAGRGVPQLVRRQTRESGLLRGRVEEPRPEVRVAQHPALWSGKHQIAGRLSGEVVRQLVGQEAGDRNRASLMGLGRADDHPTVNFGDSLRRPRSGVACQVDPAGGQGHELAPAQAGVGQDSDQRVVGRAGLGQRLYLIMSEEALGRGHDAGEGYALGDVPDEPSIADGRC